MFTKVEINNIILTWTPLDKARSQKVMCGAHYFLVYKSWSCQLPGKRVAGWKEKIFERINK